MKQNKRKVEVLVPSRFLLGEWHLSRTHASTLEFRFCCFSGVRLKLHLVAENFIGNPCED